ncbi:hypothetical protein H2204_009051 [Knufia peltigerae]|uniref:Kinesin motor domain-containing protein n=1 Tax=Knufia peltigerae TaxID=1002370 RepID=A0AA38XYS9_9EURO|nr:hypothetical protein H2204_009051 [Knufia peltigerae]
MDKSTKTPSKDPLFQVYLRLRPPIQPQLAKQKSDPWLIVEPTTTPVEENTKSFPSHVTLQTPRDSNRRWIEQFSFTKVFEEVASQLDVFEETGSIDILKSVLQTGKDGLIATLGVTGSGKSHTILGSESQRGLTQMTLDLLFTSIGDNIRRADSTLLSALKASDVSEAKILSAATFLDTSNSDGDWAEISNARLPFSRAQTPMMDSYAAPDHPASRQSTFPRQPDVSSYSIEVDPTNEYVVLVSMYQVYMNDIKDLLSSSASSNAPTMSTRPRAAQQQKKGLPFKNTKMSPDRKVVAGLQKIVCGSYDEAMRVLRRGLKERNTASTGSNNVSSRSHAFFCIEVKKKIAMRGHADSVTPAWTGGTLSIIDLAGTERMDNAKTTGLTLAEAGKINVSLMHLGRCLEMQSEGSKAVIPFRRCKLTELLFSNSFPSSSSHAATYRPQKAVMIVTADPSGDFNATRHILKCSALARDFKVSRIASTTSTILRTTSVCKGANGGRTSPQDMINSYLTAQELEQATNEATRFAEKCVALEVRLAEEEMKRVEAEAAAEAAEEQLMDMEQQVREECWIEMEQHLEEEKERWRDAWEQEKTQNEAFMDGKLGILEKTTQFHIHEDAAEARVEELERENESLRAKLRALEQELQTRSPTKRSRGGSKSPVKGIILQETANINIATNPFLASLKARDSDLTIRAKSSEGDMHGTSEISPRKQSLRRSNVSHATVEEQPPTTVKKQRKLTTRKWDLGDPNGF